MRWLLMNVTVVLLANITVHVAMSSESDHDQIQCTMCSSCHNPCNHSPPPPPPSSTNNCPPPPSPSAASYYYSPPPPPPASTGGGIYYYPPPSNRNYPGPPPPNPIVPYFPFYFYNPPPASMTSVASASRGPWVVFVGAALCSALVLLLF